MPKPLTPATTEELDRLQQALLTRMAGHLRRAAGPGPTPLQIAMHEAAHCLAALSTKGGTVHDVQLYSAAQAQRRGEYGHTAHTVALPADEAAVSLSGYAWEELQGDVDLASDDLILGHRHAVEDTRFAESDGTAKTDHLTKARQFVYANKALIAEAGAKFIAALPKTGVLRGRTLDKLVGWMRLELMTSQRARHMCKQTK